MTTDPTGDRSDFLASLRREYEAGRITAEAYFAAGGDPEVVRAAGMAPKVDVAAPQWRAKEPVQEAAKPTKPTKPSRVRSEGSMLLRAGLAALAVFAVFVAVAFGAQQLGKAGTEPTVTPSAQDTTSEPVVTWSQPAPLPASKSCASSDGKMKVSINLDSPMLEAKFTVLDPQLAKSEGLVYHLWGVNYGASGDGPAYLASAPAHGGPVSVFDLDKSVNDSSGVGTLKIKGNVATVKVGLYFSWLGEGWQWNAVLSDNGQDVSSCTDGLGQFISYPS